MTEVWKDIPGYEGKYQASSLGRIRSKRGVLKLRDNFGYQRVMLYGLKGGRKSLSVHRLVAKTFIPNPNNYPQINHIDENKSNNRIDNLEWCTQSQNINAGTVLQRMSATKTNGKKSKAVDQFALNGEFIAHYPSLNEIARQCGYNPSNISSHIRGSSRYAHPYGYIWRYSAE